MLVTSICYKYGCIPWSRREVTGLQVVLARHAEFGLQQASKWCMGFGRVRVPVYVPPSISFFIRGHLQNLNFKFEKFKHNFETLNDFKWKSWKLKSFILYVSSSKIVWKTQKIQFQLLHIGFPRKKTLGKELVCQYYNTCGLMWQKPHDESHNHH